MHLFSSWDVAALLLFLASLFTYLNIKWFKLPTTIGLMAQALGLSVILLALGLVFPSLPELARDILDQIDFSDLLLNLMLSFLLFAGALSTHLEKLKEEFWPILTLATLGILLTTGIIATALWLVLPWVGISISYLHCLLFGALISPTDPIAVLAMMKNLHVSKNLEIKIAGESLFNDGIGVVIFLTLLQISQQGAEQVSTTEIALLFVQEVVGGAALGALIGFVLFHMFRLVDVKHVEMEVLMTLAGVLVGTQVAHHLHLSAPLAMVVAGLFIGNEGRDLKMAEYKSEYIIKFWHLLDEVLNTILFMVIGLEVMILAFQIEFVWASLIAIVVVLGSRFLGVGIPIYFLRKIRPFETGTVRILTWGGLRGGISVALALSLPDFEHKQMLVFITYAVVVFSIIFQGLTLSRVIKRFHN